MALRSSASEGSGLVLVVTRRRKEAMQCGPQLAANLSPALIQALRDHPDLVDAVKVSEFGDPEYVEECRKLAASKRFVVHGICQRSDWGRLIPPPAGNPGFRESIDEQAVRTAIEVARPQYISIHLERPLEVDSVPSFDSHRDAKEFLSCLAEDVEFIRALSGLPVHLENIHTYFPNPARPKRNADYTSDPSFIARALRATDTEFLLDVSHAQVTAWHRGEPVRAYLDRLPLDKVDEVHVCAPAMVRGELRDRHAPMGEEEYCLLEHVLTRAPVKTVSLEYGGYGPLFESRSDREALEEQLRRLRQMLEP